MAKPDPELVYYSLEIEGDKRNFNWSARFDYHGGYVGIGQEHEVNVFERVLLSPNQVKALIQFISNPNAERS